MARIVFTKTYSDGFTVNAFVEYLVNAEVFLVDYFTFPFYRFFRFRRFRRFHRLIFSRFYDAQVYLDAHGFVFNLDSHCPVDIPS